MAKADSSDAKRPNYPIESVDKALRLLLLVEQQQSVRVSEASVTLDVAVSTAHRLLAMLQYHGFVRQDAESKAYTPGPVLVRIGVGSLRGMDLRDTVRPCLESLSRELDETIHLVVRDGQQVHFLDGVESRKAVRVVSRVGTSMWAHCTSAGKALLAGLSEPELLELYPEETLPALTTHSLATRSGLFEELDRVRRDGFARNQEESEEGVGSVGLAIRNRRGSQVAALSVAMPLARLTRRHYFTAARDRAKQTVEEIAQVLP